MCIKTLLYRVGKNDKQTWVFFSGAIGTGFFFARIWGVFSMELGEEDAKPWWINGKLPVNDIANWCWKLEKFASFILICKRDVLNYDCLLNLNLVVGKRVAKETVGRVVGGRIVAGWTVIIQSWKHNWLLRDVLKNQLTRVPHFDRVEIAHSLATF